MRFSSSEGEQLIESMCVRSPPLAPSTEALSETLLAQISVRIVAKSSPD